VGSLKYHQTFEAQLQPGHHAVRIRPGGTRAGTSPSTRPTAKPSTSAVTELWSGRDNSRRSSSRVWRSLSSANSDLVPRRRGTPASPPFTSGQRNISVPAWPRLREPRAVPFHDHRPRLDVQRAGLTQPWAAPARWAASSNLSAISITPALAPPTRVR
jgi:hypothetical protein